ncbi:MAG: sugar phosphate isomerase/epimerase [Deltaproteobacteria bacterium]|nr:sugar phosphate isomerase/epimerase [Deltaproteobacteria bacterium]
MKLGAGTYAWSAAGQSLQAALEDIASIGIRHVDILGIDHGHPSMFTSSQLHDLVKLIDDLGLQISSILALYDGNMATDNQMERQSIFTYLHDIMEFSAMLGADQILYKPGDKMIDIPYQQAWDNSIAFTGKISELARHYNLLITFELVPRPFALVQTISDMDRMIREACRDNVFANIDLGHIALVRDGIDECAKIASKTIHLHLNDNDTYNHTNDIVGTGKAPIGAYVEAIATNGAEDLCRRLGIPCVAGIEIELGEHSKENLSPLDITRMSRDYVLANIPSITL